eukprot:4994327-Pleurochrysis_carterae.AAC.1
MENSPSALPMSTKNSAPFSAGDKQTHMPHVGELQKFDVTCASLINACFSKHAYLEVVLQV